MNKHKITEEELIQIRKNGLKGKLEALRHLENDINSDLRIIKTIKDNTYIGYNVAFRNKEVVDFPETGYKWNELGKLAQKFYEDYKDEDFNSLTEKLNKTIQQILQLIESKSNQELYEVSWYEKWTLGRMIQFNTSSPYINARGRIRKWKKEKGIS